MRGAVRGNTFLGSSNRRARTIVLQVEGLVDQVRERVTYLYTACPS